MSTPDNWQDESQEESLNQQTQRLGLNSQASQFTPQATAQSFTPPQFQQYGGYNQNQYQNQYQYDQGQGQYNYPYNQQYGGQQAYPQYGQGYGQPNYGQNWQQQQTQPGFNYQHQQDQRQRPIQIAKKPGNDPAPSQPQAPTNTASASAAPAAKVLSIGGDGAPKQAKTLSIGADGGAKVETAGKTKVLSIGSTTPAKGSESSTGKESKESVEKSAPQAGSKVTAAKAIEKTGEATGKAATTGKKSPTPSSGRNSPSRNEKDEKKLAKEAEDVAKEQAAEVDEETLAEMYGKEHVNVIFLGHVDAGKSTLGGSILYASGMVDERTMDKYKREAKEAGRETWYLSWALDLTKEERSQGKTVEVGRGFFETEKRRYSILDAPGHKTYVPNMIGGASQADIGILVISARINEFEAGFHKGGQTQEHAILAKTQGVNKLIIAVNKMDDPSVNWDKERYQTITRDIEIFLKKLGYGAKDLAFMPISGQQTIGIKDRVPKDIASWHDGPSLLEYLDGMKALERKVNAPFMMPITAKYRDMGTMIEGKIESGVIQKSRNYIMMPNRETISISALYGETEDEVQNATCGEQVRLRIRGVEEEDILPGFVLCSPKRPVNTVSAFEAIVILQPDYPGIISAGYNCVMHVHSATEEVTLSKLLHYLERKTFRRSKKPPPYLWKKKPLAIARIEVTGGAGKVCVERFEDYPQLGRFTLRDQGQTIAIGKITKLITEEGE